MLTHLQIRDFAIIDSVELELAAGLTALTGETGAGKSILVDAVMLAIGARAGADAVRHGAERAEITATFAVADNPDALAWLEEQSVTHEGEVQLRRVIGSDGRSRAYVNGQTLPLQVVRALGDELVDIHGQQEFLSLTRRETQRRLLDGYGGHEALLTPVQEQATAWRAASDRLQALRAATAERASLLELLRYQVRELEALALEPGEVAALLEEQTRLSHRSRLAEAAQQALGLVYEGDGQEAHSLAGRALAQLKPLQDIDARLTGPATLLQDALIQLREAGRELASYLDALDMDPARRDHVERRVAAIEELARKHRIAAQDLPAQLERLRDELQALERAESSAVELETQLATAARLHAAAAEKLSAARRSAAKRLGTAVTDLMRVLGMPGGQFEVAVAPRADDTPSAQGRDDIDFLVSANPGQPPRPVARVASGGELSRISLAVQVAAVDRSRGRLCMIFDEVDAGVGGGVAERVGQQLHALGTQGQVLCVTHLPQVASQADQQVRVAKLTDGRTSRTSLATLDRDERIEELARMLGGVEITQKAREHAAEMLKPREVERTPRRRETRGRRGA